MNELITQSQTISSLEIAEMMGVTHWEILRKLTGSSNNKGYIEILGDNKIVVTDYFIKSTYLTDQNKEMPCYQITKMGCEFLANKFTGEKGVIFSAKYVKRFNEMEQQMISHDGLSAELQMFSQMFKAVANQEQKMKQIAIKQSETDKKLDTALDIFTADTEDDWKTQTNAKINRICKEHGLSYLVIKHDLYKELEATAHCDLSARQRNYKARLKKSGATYKECQAVSKIDIIDRDNTLRAIFDGIVRKFQAKYIQGDNVQEGLL